MYAYWLFLLPSFNGCINYMIAYQARLFVLILSHTWMFPFIEVAVENFSAFLLAHYLGIFISGFAYIQALPSIYYRF